MAPIASSVVQMAWAHDRGAAVDTEAAAFDLQIESWRRPSVAERAALAEQMCFDVELLARAGMRRHVVGGVHLQDV